MTAQSEARDLDPEPLALCLTVDKSLSSWPRLRPCKGPCSSKLVWNRFPWPSLVCDGRRGSKLSKVRLQGCPSPRKGLEAGGRQQGGRGGTTDLSALAPGLRPPGDCPQPTEAARLPHRPLRRGVRSPGSQSNPALHISGPLSHPPRHSLTTDGVLPGRHPQTSGEG